MLRRCAERPRFWAQSRRSCSVTPTCELDTLPAGVLREKFIRAIRQLKPDVVVAEDPYAPFEPHPDHRVVAWAATEAINFARLPLFHPEHLAEGLTLHLVVEKYFYANVPTLTNKCIDISEASAAQGGCVGRAQEPDDVPGGRGDARGGGGRPGPAGDVRRSGPTTRPRCLAWAMQVEAAKVGQQFGVPYGEVYRFERFTPLIESVLAQVAAGNPQ